MQTDEKIEKLIAERLKLARRILGDMTQKEFAVLVGVSQEEISHWENGKRKITAAMLHRIEAETELEHDFFVKPDYNINLSVRPPKKVAQRRTRSRE